MGNNNIVNVNNGTVWQRRRQPANVVRYNLKSTTKTKKNKYGEKKKKTHAHCNSECSNNANNKNVTYLFNLFIIIARRTRAISTEVNEEKRKRWKISFEPIGGEKQKQVLVSAKPKSKMKTNMLEESARENKVGRERERSRDLPCATVKRGFAASKIRNSIYIKFLAKMEFKFFFFIPYFAWLFRCSSCRALIFSNKHTAHTHTHRANASSCYHVFFSFWFRSFDCFACLASAYRLRLCSASLERFTN